MNYNDINSIIDGFFKILNFDNVGTTPQIPSPLIFVGVPKRTGLSPIKIAARIIARKNEAGLNVGTLPSGAVNPDEIMERIRVEEIIKALQEEAIISVAIPPGIALTAMGVSPTGPVTVYGSTITFSKGFGIIQ